MCKKNVDNLSTLMWHLDQEKYMVFVVEKGTILVYENIMDKEEDNKIVRQELVFTYPYFSRFLENVEKDIESRLRERDEEQDRISGVRDFPEGTPVNLEAPEKNMGKVGFDDSCPNKHQEY